MDKIKSVKKINLLILIAFTPVLVNSQILSSYGIKGGVVFATQKYDYTENFNLVTKYKTGLDLGFFIECFRKPYFSGLAEVHYAQKGFKMSVPVTTPQQPEGTGQYLTFYPEVDYLSVPLLFKARLENKMLSAYAFVGPRIDIKVGHNKDYGSSNYNELKPVDFGASIGFGIQHTFTNKMGFLIEGRYSYPFTSSVSNSIVTVKNYSFEILAGISFDLAKNKKI